MKRVMYTVLAGLVLVMVGGCAKPPQPVDVPPDASEAAPAPVDESSAPAAGAPTEAAASEGEEAVETAAKPGQFYCTMHPDVISDQPGNCPKCEMTLVPAQRLCPVSGDPIDTRYSTEYEGKTIYFCCETCPLKFKADPAKYMAKLEAESTGDAASTAGESEHMEGMEHGEHLEGMEHGEHMEGMEHGEHAETGEHAGHDE